MTNWSCRLTWCDDLERGVCPRIGRRFRRCCPSWRGEYRFPAPTGRPTRTLARVTVVSAPPGSGKTVLLRSWIGQAGAVGCAAWVPVGPATDEDQQQGRLRNR